MVMMNIAITLNHYVGLLACTAFC